ncbi:hypothetical protein RFI_17463 [Reticulomyxa filosa]|uniref:Uncharacterized protein n=1 Tax=Reticulomyxa filosa TaxID=46433 RepID=X6N117_RETFI|nr:hypothetical protein RFI_17463 [Reticulomyxa filosa]|eukprot:ETO19766.1 hypothetical protein RFI_17463 [Reticulomyxa filosa]
MTTEFKNKSAGQEQAIVREESFGTSPRSPGDILMSQAEATPGKPIDPKQQPKASAEAATELGLSQDEIERQKKAMKLMEHKKIIIAQQNELQKWKHKPAPPPRPPGKKSNTAAAAAASAPSQVGQSANKPDSAPARLRDADEDSVGADESGDEKLDVLDAQFETPMGLPQNQEINLNESDDEVPEQPAPELEPPPLQSSGFLNMPQLPSSVKTDNSALENALYIKIVKYISKFLTLTLQNSSVGLFC